jgi:four helix bundle protein
MKSFRKMAVWKVSTELAVLVTISARRFPREEQFGLAAQLRRAAVSVPSNIAEGWGRSGAKEFAHFITIALGSLAELETQLHIAERLDYIPSDEARRLENLCSAVNAKLRALKRHLDK